MNIVPKKYVLISTLLHLMIVLGFPFGLELPKLPEGQTDIPNTVDIIDKPENYNDEENDTKLDKRSIVEKKNDNQKSDDCNNYFGGIGVTINYTDSGYINILKIHKGYPAHVRGLRVGDKLKPLDNEGLIGKIGTKVRLIVVRNNKKYITTIIRGKICVEDINL